MSVKWTDRFDENDGLRIGSKVAALTQANTTPRSPTFNRYPYSYTPNSVYQNPNFYYYYYPNQSNVMRSRRHAPIENNPSFLTEIRNESLKQSYGLQPLFDTSPMEDDESIDADASIDFADKVAEEEAEELFNVEALIMKTLGIKKYTPMYCAKEYTINVMDRFIDELLLG